MVIVRSVHSTSVLKVPNFIIAVVALVFSSSVMSTQMAPLETVEIGEAAITGSTATVPVTTEGSTELFQLVLAGDSWKLNSFL